MQSDAIASKGVFRLCDSPLIGPYLSKCSNAKPDAKSISYPGWVQTRSSGDTTFTLEGVTCGPTDNVASIWSTIDVDIDIFMHKCIETIKTNICHLKNQNMATQKDLTNITLALEGSSLYLQAIMFGTSSRYKVLISFREDYFDYKCFSIEYEHSQLVNFGLST